ncbi:hypothetical protein [Gracilibacillus salitolerans]|uniref:hypothetical protein n=1 Tax=Gracilibacillus salitolerans TaxID=2663022 RepID=UPI001E336706|nr:hypothetical protein [Gracilibacillus salitolerans]
MNKKWSASQVLFMTCFVVLVLAIFEFAVPEFNWKSIVFIILCGVSAYVGGRLSFVAIKND